VGKKGKAFGKSGSFEEMYPEVKTLGVVVRVKDLGPSEENIFKFDRETIIPMVSCRNPICHKGGLSLHSLIGEMITQRLQMRENVSLCLGFEGSEKGKKKYKPCTFQFQYKIEIQYKDEPTL
jgi:hypothetical protein